MSKKAILAILICLAILVIAIPLLVRVVVFRNAKGNIVYDKASSGNYARIYLTNAIGFPTSQLSANDGWDVGAVLSPDGTQIVFECHIPDVGLCIMNSDGSNRTRIPEVVGRPMYPNWSPDGRKIVFQTYGIYTVSSDGSNLTRLTESSSLDYWQPVWSPDGRKIAYGVIDGENWDIYLMNSDGSEKDNLTDHTGKDSSPLWSVDGAYIFFISDRSGDDEIYRMNVDGTDIINLTNSPETDDYLGDISPDGQKIVFSVHPRDLAPQEIDIYSMNSDGTGRTRLTKTADYDSNPVWSPDGQYIAFISARRGNWYVYVMTAQGKYQTRISSSLTASGVSWQP